MHDPHYDVDFSDPQVNYDPWQHLENVRAVGTVVYNPPTRSWFVSSFDDVRKVLARDHEFGPALDFITELFGDVSMLGSDNPRHDALRGIWMPYLVRSSLTRWDDIIDRVIDAQVSYVVARLRDGDTVDALPHLRMIPTRVVAQMIGVSAEDADLFMDWGQKISLLFDAYSAPDAAEAEAMRASGRTARAELNAYCADQLERRHDSGDSTDLIGVLANSDVPMTAEEMRSYITIFIAGAQDTTTKFMVSALAALAEHPSQREQLRHDMTLMPQTIDEVGRWRGPVMLDTRVARGDVELNGVAISGGEQVSLMLASANRDPARWSDPSRFDIHRESKGHVGFGFGLHSCMGINLARIIITRVLTLMLERVPEYRVAEPLDFGASFHIRGAGRLVLTL